MMSRSLSFVPAVLLLAIAPLAAQGLPKPQAEHQRLARAAGTWDAAIETIGLDGRPHGSKGVSVQRMGPGGLWLLEDFEGEMMGIRTAGHGALGYDPQKQRYVQSWVSLSPMLMVFTGTFDAAGKVLTMTGDGPGIDGTRIRMKNVTTWTGADSMTVEVFVVLPDGKEQKSMTIVYTRRAEKPADHGGGKK